MNYSPLIYAFEAENIAITGTGTLDGQADAEPLVGAGARQARSRRRRQAAARARLIDIADRGVPVAERVFGEGHYLRPNFIQPYRCRNVLIEGVTIINSPMWEIHPVLCRTSPSAASPSAATARTTTAAIPSRAATCSSRDCTFDTGDDCIAIKSGRNADGRRVNVPSENIIIRDCTMKDGHGGVVIGSEISGGVRNVFVERCRMDSPQLDRALRLKTNSVRGGIDRRTSTCATSPSARSPRRW